MYLIIEYENNDIYRYVITKTRRTEETDDIQQDIEDIDIDIHEY